MVYSYTPTYYSTLHDSITNLCKTILPFSLKKRRLPAAEQKLAKLQSDNLKWQQDSFHQIINLMGLHKEGILAAHEVSAFRSHLLDTLVASPADQEQPAVLRDKLIFLQELVYAKCISEEEYHSSKRPLLQRLAVQGVEIGARDVIVAGEAKEAKENSDEEWSVIDLKDEQSLLHKEKSNSKNKSKHGSAMKQIKGAASVLSFVTPYKPKRNKEEKSIFDSISENSGTVKELSCSRENPFWDAQSILVPDSVKKKPDSHHEKVSKSAKKQWGFDGFKKWKKNESEDETAPLPLSERSDHETCSETGKLVATPMGEGPDTKQIKKKLHSDGSSSDFFIDKVLGDRIKKELSRIQAELCKTNPSLQFSDDQIEAISTKLPVDKTDLKKFFPKTWCDRYGDVVLDVVKKEFKGHVGEMENLRNAAKERRWTTFEDDENCHPNLFAQRDHHSATPLKHQNYSKSNDAAKERHWTTFEDDENCHPNLFAQRDHHSATPLKHQNYIKSNDACFENNPFFHDYSGSDGTKLSQDHNPFWTPGHGST